MKRVSLIVCMFLSIGLFSQTNDTIKTIDSAHYTPVRVPNPDRGSTDTTKTTKFEIGFSFSPEYSFRKLTANGDESSKMIKQIRDTLEVPKFGYSVGINIAYHLNNKISIETGLLFSDKGEKTKKTSFTDVPSGQKSMYYTYKFHYYYLDIPLKVNYYLTSGKLKLYVTAGVSVNIFINQKTTLIQGHDKTDWKRTNSSSHPEFKTVNFAGMAGAGINYKINNKLDFKAEPLYSRSLTSIINAPVKEYLYSMGVSVGVSRKLGMKN